jgi:hypothetical protein
MSFAEHQRHYQAKFYSILQTIREAGTAECKLSEAPTKKMEIEILDHNVLEEHGCGMHCPCDLDSARNVDNKILVLEHDTGITQQFLLETVRNFVYGEEDATKYRLMQDIFSGGLTFDKFNWMSSAGELNCTYRNKGKAKVTELEHLPCLFVEVSGNRI